MMKSLFKSIFVLIYFASTINAQDKTDNRASEKYSAKLDKISALHKSIKEIHPALQKIYPVAIAEDGQLLIFEPDQNDIYHLVKVTASMSPIPKGIRAAYPLAENENKMTCVVTGEVFDSMDGYAIIFHEFVHCAVFVSDELKLKENLNIYKKAMEQKNWMWELNYPFPYSKKEFAESYGAFLSAVNKGDMNDVLDIRQTVREQLSPEEFSYLVWVEWKEGFARWIENKVRNKFGIKENHAGGLQPYGRVTFYEGGSRLMEMIYSQNPQTVYDFSKLYDFIRQ